MGKVEHQEQMRREGWGVTKEGNTQGTDNGRGGGGGGGGTKDWSSTLLPFP